MTSKVNSRKLIAATEREFFIDKLLVRIYFIIVMIRWTGLAPWEFIFPFSSSLASERDRFTDTRADALPHGGLRRFRWGRNLGCDVTKFAPHKALKFFCVRQVDFCEAVPRRAHI